MMPSHQDHSSQVLEIFRFVQQCAEAEVCDATKAGKYIIARF